MIYPLIDARSVRQSGLGPPRRELPLSERVLPGCKATVLRVLPVGHPENPSGQTLCDVQPHMDVPLLFHVPLAADDAHEDTPEQQPNSPFRQPYAPKPKNRMSGSAADVRPGSFVWVDFHRGSIWEPIITAALKFNQLPGDQAPYVQVVDRIQPDGTIAPTPTRPLDAHLETPEGKPPVSSYPRRVSSYNGCRDEIDNAGNRFIQTSTDRKPCFPGYAGVPAAPTPEGSYGVSTRGAVAGHIGFTTGAAPTPDDASPAVRAAAASAGRQFRQTVGADDGTIRDETASTVGNIIARIRSGGRYYVSARDGKDGVVYHEAAGGAYTKLDGDADIYGGTGIMNTGTVKLGGPGMSDEVVLWPQLCDVLSALCAIFDAHVHGGVQSGGSFTDPTQTPQSPTFDGGKDSFKAADVLAGQSASPQANTQDDPDAKGKS
jgi:hypothetical protein